jgi:tetratricopeptide (TPR) repeat protein
VKQSTPLRAFARDILILLILLLLILTPRPTAGYLYLRQARLFDAIGNHLSAAHAYAMAAERLPWDPELWQKAGMAAQLGNQLTDAVSFMNQAVAQDVISQPGWLSLGMTYQKLGDLPAAVNAWQHALPLPEAYRNLAQAQRKMGNFPDAMASWRASLVTDSKNASAQYQLGLLEMAVTPKDALPELMQAAQIDPALDASVQSLRSALNTAFLSDDRAYQFVISGRALGASENWDLAAEAFRNAIAERADYAEAWAWLGEARQRLGQDGSAEIERALALNPNSAMIQSLYGLYLQRQKQPKLALTAFQKAATLEPENPGWQMALGGAYEQAGNLVAAIEHYQRAVEISPNEATAWRALAVFSLRNSVDVTGIGLPAARRLVELANSDWESDDIAGQILLENGDIIGAEALLIKALELDPTQAAPALHLGILYLQAGNHAAAYSYLNQAKIFDPDGPYGWQAKRLLEQFFP